METEGDECVPCDVFAANAASLEADRAKEAERVAKQAAADELQRRIEELRQQRKSLLPAEPDDGISIRVVSPHASRKFSVGDDVQVGHEDYSRISKMFVK